MSSLSSPLDPGRGIVMAESESVHVLYQPMDQSFSKENGINTSHAFNILPLRKLGPSNLKKPRFHIPHRRT